MAITAYVGVPGSGKSYEVVKSVIIPALIKGRRVVSNVYGLKVEDIYTFCRAKTKNEIGELVCVTNDQCKDPEFLPYKDSTDTFCKPGDLICLDEVWKFWASDKDIHEHHRSFVAEHRHFADETTGFTCDFVVINQAIVNLPRFIKDRIESTFKMTKLKSLGLTSRYRVDVFIGTKLTKTNLSTQSFSKYEKKIYSLYESYETKGAVETKVDDRGNLFKNRKFLFGIFFVIACFYFAISTLIGFFHTPDKEPAKAKSENATLEKSGPKPMQTFEPVKFNQPKLSRTWQIRGSYKTDKGAFVILSSSDGNKRIEPMSNFSYSGSLMSGVIDGELVTTYSGDFKK